MNLGVAYMVAMALVIGIVMHWDPPGGGSLSVGPTITGIGPLLLITAAVVACRQGKCWQVVSWPHPWIRSAW